jgi:hypothetical protein
MRFLLGSIPIAQRSQNEMGRTRQEFDRCQHAMRHDRLVHVELKVALRTRKRGPRDRSQKPGLRPSRAARTEPTRACIRKNIA